MHRDRPMLVRRYLIALTLALIAAGCLDQAGPSPTGVQASVAEVVSPLGTHIIQQAVNAPRLATYRVSFWAKRGTQKTIFVNYRRATGQWFPDPFLRFKIPINGLVAGAGGVAVRHGDSVFITMTIDTVLFKVDFEPSGLIFSASSPAQLAVWYKNADPDLNEDGIVDATDEALRDQLAFWYHGKVWLKQWSRSDPTQLTVSGSIYHFSQYAVAW